ncbi:MAG: hypothetical protein BWY06_00565 [Candidatus Latescibacteria bacterium ADurb.Bin168]|nr:MAG: hypothetical protein BWY06_00565 [Candidatus Latescibacteria bacterium ADurb.Bin168]
MAKIPVSAFPPNWVVTPGELVQDHLTGAGITRNGFVEKTGLAAETLDAVIADEIRITEDIAEALARGLGLPVSFWVNLQAHFDSEAKRLKIPVKYVSAGRSHNKVGAGAGTRVPA